jgi:hypothetical protein
VGLSRGVAGEAAERVINQHGGIALFESSL